MPNPSKQGHRWVMPTLKGQKNKRRIGKMNYVTPAIKGGITAAAAGTVGAMVSGLFAPIAPYSAIVGGALALIAIETFWKG
jgi:hypothetical protein